MPGADLDVVKDIPGYKLILKAVLKSQIQQLVEQLADHTGEESVILTASVSDGSLSHLGSESGKVFLEDHDDIKSQFLGFCLKRYHTKQKQIEKEKQLQTLLDPGEVLRDVPLTQRVPGTGPRPRFFSGSPSAQKLQAPLHPVSAISSPSSVQSPSLSKAPRAGTNVRHVPYSKNKSGKTSSNMDQQGLSAVLESSRQGAVGSVGTRILKMEPADVKTETEGGDFETNDDKSKEPCAFSGTVDSVSEADDSSTANIPSMRKFPSSRLASKLPLSEDGMSSSSNEPADVKFSESMPPSGFGVDSDIPKFSNVAGDSESIADASDEADVIQSENSYMDPNIKVEGVRESEMDLEIIGVHPGSMAQSDNNWAPAVQNISSHGISSSEASGSFSEGEIASQTSQGFGNYFPVRKISCDDNKMYVCIECGQSFSFPSALKVHHRIHAGVKPHVCGECGKSFTQKNNLYRHMRNIHQAKTESSGKELDDGNIKTESSGKELNDVNIK